MNQSVSLEVFYPHPLERVWQALTDRRALAEWMMDNDFEPRLGHKFHFRQPGFNAEIQGEVVELDPPRRLVYLWQSPSEPSAIVAWTLTAVPGGTSLQLKHDRFVPDPVASSPVSLPRFVAPRATTTEAIAGARAYESTISAVVERFFDRPQNLLYGTSRAIALRCPSGAIAPSVLELRSQWDSCLCRLKEQLNTVKLSD